MSVYQSLHAHGESPIKGDRLVRWDYLNHPAVRLPLADCVSPDVVMVKLAQAGLPVRGREGRDRICSQLADVTTCPPALIAGSPGWNGPHYAISDGRVISPDGSDPVIAGFQVCTRAPATTGSIKRWRRKVARPLVGQHLPIFAISYALAVPLFEIMGIARGVIVELVGPSCIGKTRVQ